MRRLMTTVLVTMIILLGLFSLFFSSRVLGVSATVVLAALAFYHPKAGLLFLPVYIPIREALITINPSLKAIGDAAILFAFLRVGYDEIRAGSVRGLMKLQAFEWAYLFFVAFGAGIALSSGISLTAVVFQIRAFLLMYLVFYVVRRLNGMTAQDVRLFLWLCFATAVIVCLQGLVEKVSLRTLLLPKAWENWQLADTNRIRIYGLMGNPNVLAYYLGITGILTLYLKSIYVRAKTPAVNWMLTLGLVLFSGVFILTYSRGAIIAFIITLIVFLLFGRTKRVAWSILLPVVCGLALIFYPANFAADYVQKNFAVAHKSLDAGNRFTDAFNDQNISYSMQTGRLYVVKKGLTIFLSHPITGTGFATYGDSAAHAYGSSVYTSYHLPKNMYADNQYIEILVETGIGGTLLFSVYLLALLVKLWTMRLKTSLATLLLSIYLGALVAGLYYNIWEDKLFTFFFFTLLGILFHFKRGMADESFASNWR
ncbi:O-antigen ligase family protein [Camelliibacillus cellulosilyticus]|uniref:O-antigen ligase family protein n=1 Tax=Camelliibacillus cellulosilyticus TaxID=2174486 RepID=A0ABV9GN01_9BACL